MFSLICQLLLARSFSLIFSHNSVSQRLFAYSRCYTHISHILRAQYELTVWVNRSHFESKNFSYPNVSNSSSFLYLLLRMGNIGLLFLVFTIQIFFLYFDLMFEAKNCSDCICICWVIVIFLYRILFNVRYVNLLISKIISFDLSLRFHICTNFF